MFQLLPVVRQDLSIVQLPGCTEGATEFKMFMTFIQIINIELQGPKILQAHYNRCWFLLKYTKMTNSSFKAVPHF